MSYALLRTGFRSFRGFGSLGLTAAQKEAQARRKDARAAMVAQRKTATAAKKAAVVAKRADVKAAQAVKKAANVQKRADAKAARLAKRVGGKTISVSAAGAQVADQLQAAIEAGKKKSADLKAKLNQIKARPPRAKKAMRGLGFMDELFGHAPRRRMGYIDPITGQEMSDEAASTDGATGSTTPDNSALMYQLQAELATAKEAQTTACAKRPNSPKCMYAKMDSSDKQQMLFLIMILDQINQSNAAMMEQIMALLNQGYGSGAGPITGYDVNGQPIYGNQSSMLPYDPYSGVQMLPQVASPYGGGMMVDPYAGGGVVGGAGGSYDPYGGGFIETGEASSGGGPGGGYMEAGPVYGGSVDPYGGGGGVMYADEGSDEMQMDGEIEGGFAAGSGSILSPSATIFSNPAPAPSAPMFQSAPMNYESILDVEQAEDEGGRGMEEEMFV